MRTLSVTLVILVLLLAGCASTPEPSAGEEDAAAIAKPVPYRDQPLTDAVEPEVSDLETSIQLVSSSIEATPRVSQHTFGISVGGAVLGDFNTTLRFKPKRGPISASLRLEDDLGFDNTVQVVNIEAFYRFNRRHRVDVSYFDIERTSKRRTNGRLVIGDTELPETKLKLTFDTEIIRAIYQYNFIVRPDWEMGFNVGLHWTRLEIGYDLLVKEFKDNGKRIQDNEVFRQELPLPVVGIQGMFAFSDDWRLKTSVQLFRVNAFDVKADLIDFRLGLQWDWLRHVGLELTYNFFLLDAEYERSGYKAEVRYNYQGIIFALRIYF